MNFINDFKTSKKVTTSLIIVLFILINWISYGLSWRADLSASGRFKITSATQDILENLPEKVTIEAFFSEDVPEMFIQPVKQLRDFLTEYESTGGSKVKLRFLNPDDDPKIQARARSLGIQPMPIGAQGGNKSEYSNVYFSIALSYEDKVEIIPDILRAAGQVLEYNITSRIFKMAYPGLRQVGFWANATAFTPGESQNPFQSLAYINNAMEPFYGPFVPVQGTEIPDEVTTLVILQPSFLSEEEELAIDQFLMKGGKLILAMSGVEINFQNGMGRPADAGTLSFFEHYGIQIQPAYILEEDNYLPMVNQRDIFSRQQWKYPMWVRTGKTGLSKTNMTSNMKDLFLPWVSPVQINEDMIESPQTSVLAKSTGNSWLIKQQININPDLVQNLHESGQRPDQGSYSMGVRLQGKFQSFFSGTPAAKNPGFLSQSAAAADIVVIGTPYIFADSSIQQSQGLNLNFFLSALDVMNGLDELVLARNRDVSLPLLESVEPAVKTLFNALNFLLPLLSVGGYGLIRFLSRKKIQNLEYNPGVYQESAENREEA